MPSSFRTTTQQKDPISDARALVAMAVGLGHRSRQAHRLSAITDRKASLYINSLVRHASRLLQSSMSHDIPTLHVSSSSPGGNTTHFVLRHDRLVGPPSAIRFLVVGSDAGLRCCVVSEHGGTRIWADYDIATAPADLPMRVVLDALSALIAQLDEAVTHMESTELTRELQLEADIAASRARIAGLTGRVTPLGKRQPVNTEEPVRPWTRHVRSDTGPTPRELPPAITPGGVAESFPVDEEARARREQRLSRLGPHDLSRQRHVARGDAAAPTGR